MNENRFVGFALLLDNIPDEPKATGKTAHKVHTLWQCDIATLPVDSIGSLYNIFESQLDKHLSLQQPW